MSTPIPRQTVEAIVKLACRAPSADNNQPFVFEAQAEADRVQLRVFHDGERGRHRLNIDDAVSRLALGFIAESLALSAGQHGVVVHFEQPQWSDTGPQLVASLQAGDILRDPLAVRLSTRCTDRRPFGRGAMPAILADSLTADPGSPAETRTVVVRACSRRLSAALEDADSLIWSTPGAFADALAWVREDSTPPAADGMPRATLGTSFIEGTAIAALVAQPRLTDAFPAATMRIAGRRTLARQLRASSALVAVLVRAPKPPALVDVGRAAMRAWLRLDAAQWAVQPMSLAPLAVWYGAQGLLPTDLSTRMHRRLLGVTARLQAAVGAQTDELPLWLMRTGPAPTTPAARTGRLPVSRALRWSGEGR